MPISFRQIESLPSQGFEEFLFDTNEYYSHHYGNGEDFSDEQVEWMQVLYEEFADEDGYIDWHDHSHNSFWYYYLTEVLGYDEDVIDRYVED